VDRESLIDISLPTLHTEHKHMMVLPPHEAKEPKLSKVRVPCTTI